MSFLTKKIFDFVGTASGIDLNDSSVRVAQMERNSGKDSVIGYGFADIIPGSISDGEIKNKDQVILAIKKAFSSSVPKKIKSKKVVCSLPETKAFLRIISIPKMDQEEAKEAIKWEIEANIPLTLDQVYYDWKILDKNVSSEKNKMDVLIVAISRNTVDQFVEVMEQAGLEVVGMEIESIAQARSLLPASNQEKSSLVLDLDDMGTSFFISSGNVPCFTSSVPVSGRSLNNSISKSLNVSLEEAEKIKNNYGIGSEFKNNNIFLAVKPVLENLVSEIERSTEFFVSELGYSSAIDEIILCGKEANIKGIVTYLSKRLGKKVILGDPWINVSMKGKLPEIEKNLSVEYSTAIGLALRGMNYEDIS
ncbi:MAG: Type IV pilus assembly protein PilM [uncultured bacterium]|nr:MAG: Type IV pilus assembly protein PilM [uncultured bacterium]HBR71773.1 hypothetical protein [Candidatus Moranbacteria bacterium]